MPEPDVAYALVFDVCRDGYRYWWFPAIGVVFGILCFIEDHVLKRGRIRPLPPKEALSRRMGYVFSVVWTVTSLYALLSDYSHKCGSMRDRDFTVVEGTVHHFGPAFIGLPFSGETFAVGDHRYEYSDFFLHAAFNNTQMHGGPIREGLQVRIHDVDGQIARLEVAR